MNNKNEDILEIVSKELKSIKNLIPQKLLGVDYVSICALALELAEDILGENVHFPVDIEDIVRQLGVDIIYQPLNALRQEGERRVHKMVGTILKRPGIVTPFITCILIDSESKQEEQRYALAHELAHYLMHYDESVYASAYHLMPMLFKDMEEMIADIFAIFLLIPLPAFFDEFYEYINAQNKLVRTSEWLRYLSIIANVSYEEVSIGYQNIRYVSEIIYKLKKGVISMDKLGEQVEEITSSKDLKNEVTKNIVIKQFTKMMEKMSDEMEKVLYA